MTRHNERELAFQVLYSVAFTPVKDNKELHNVFLRSPKLSQNQESQGFSWQLVEGVWSNTEELDKIISQFAHNWKISRIGRIELVILRIATYEMLYLREIPYKVTINEALELCNKFGDQASKSFLNGILDSTSKALEKGQITPKIADENL